jgi:nucleoid-associated protein EbfC
MNFSNLMKQASQMQSKMQDMQATIEALTVEGTAGVGLVRITLTGRGELCNLIIDPKLADPGEMETLQDLIMAAHNNAKQKLDAVIAAETQKATGGLNLGGLKLPF